MHKAIGEIVYSVPSSGGAIAADFKGISARDAGLKEDWYQGQAFTARQTDYTAAP